MTSNDVNIADLLKEDYVVPESVFDKKRTKTTHFLLNTVFPNSSLTAIEFFVNAFLTDEGFSHCIPRAIFVLFKADSNDPKWEAVLKRLRSKNEYILDYFVGIEEDIPLRMVIFQIPEKHANEYVCFRKGRYSKFTEEYKKTFARYAHNERGNPVESVIWRVVYKSPELRKELQNWIGNEEGDYHFTEEDELWGIPTAKYEHYRHKELN